MAVSLLLLLWQELNFGQLHHIIAFTFALLDWAEALMLECQVALKDFCNCLKFKSPFQTLKVANNE